MKIIESLKPKVPKRYLLFIAAVVWTFAGGMLLFKGISLFVNHAHYIWLKILISAIAGALFYILLFSKISFKHTNRIINLKIDKPCAFSFFNTKSYVMMISMITLGILLRKSGLVSLEYLSVLYVTMGIPLFLSSLRFYYTGINYKKIMMNC